MTPLIGQSTNSSFFVVRHTDYSSTDVTSYTLKVPTSTGTLAVPQLGGALTLNGRDSKVHVTDYNVSGTNVLYSTAEIFTWKKFTDYSALVVYGGQGEHHELAISSTDSASVVEGSKKSVTTKSENGQLVIAWDVSSSRSIVKVGDLLVFLLGKLPIHAIRPKYPGFNKIIDRNSVYNYWVPQIDSSAQKTDFSAQSSIADSLVVNAGYLVRTVYLQGSQLHLTADFNATTKVEVIGAPSSAESLYINGVQQNHQTDSNGFWSATVKYSAPKISLPDFTKSEWKYVDSLPEFQSSYDDSAWVAATYNSSNNDVAPLTTPMSLYASDYGFHTGYLLYRGHFVANGNESSFSVNTQGGTGFGSSVWLNESFLGSWDGNANDANQSSTYKLPTTLKSGSNYVLTVVVDNLGLDENFEIGLEEMKDPRGILDYDLSGHSQSDITWKLTGNLGGEDYVDLVRGPLNEGGLYAERQGWHQPSPPSKEWKTSSPLSTGLSQPGVAFYSTSFKLDFPKGYDIPLYFVFGNNTSTEQPYRVQLYVNGYQFGKFVPHIGPQGEFPVPQGILNYQGENWVAVTLWAHESSGAKLSSFELINRTPVLTALSGITASEQPAYKKRAGAY